MTVTKERIAAKTIRVAIVGLGYVGLPLALTFVEAGVGVVGLDVDSDKVDRLNAGTSYLRHIADARIVEAVQAGLLTATDDFSRVADCDVVLICVPTPIGAHMEPDLSFVERTAEQIAVHLAPDSLVVLESTTWPGTTEEVVRRIIERDSDRRVGEDLYLAYSPEREDPGRTDHTTKTIPKLVGGSDADSAALAQALYGLALDTIVPCSSTRVAESAKLVENIFRNVNIALVNELKVIFDRMGVDVWEVIEAAKTKPFGFMPFYPGPGLGGHCIPVDPFYLTWKAKEFGLHTRFIELAGEINRAMPAWVIGKVQDCLNERGKALKGSRILVLGVAYKAGVDDLRESPSLGIIAALQDHGVDVAYHDPYVPEIPVTRKHAPLAGLQSQMPDASWDCFLLLTAHQQFDESLLDHGVPVVDTRNVFGRVPGVYRA